MGRDSSSRRELRWCGKGTRTLRVRRPVRRIALPEDRRERHSIPPPATRTRRRRRPLAEAPIPFCPGGRGASPDARTDGRALRAAWPAAGTTGRCRGPDDAWRAECTPTKSARKSAVRSSRSRKLCADARPPRGSSRRAWRSRSGSRGDQCRPGRKPTAESSPHRTRAPAAARIRKRVPR